MPDVDKVAIFVDDVLVVDNALLKTNADYVAGVESTNNALDVEKVAISTDRYGKLNANIDNYDYFSDILSGYVDGGGLNLHTTVFTDNVSGGKVVWTSSNKDVISDDGVVTVPAVMTPVKIEFKLSDAQNTDVYVKREFTVAVDCDNSKNIVYRKVPTVSFKDPDYPQANISDNNTDTVFKVVKANMNDSDIIFDLGGKKNFNSIFILPESACMNGYSVSVSDDNKTWRSLAEGDMSGINSLFAKLENTAASYVKLTVKNVKLRNLASEKSNCSLMQLMKNLRSQTLTQ